MQPKGATGAMTIRTRRTFDSTSDAIWPLLCNSRMETAASPVFKFGVPVPVECRLPDGHGGVGSERQCVSDQGVVHQRILEWAPQTHLVFRMEQTDLFFGQFVDEMVESFDLVQNPQGVELTRTTNVWVRGRLALLKKCFLYLGVKQVHRYVFRNWQRLASSHTLSANRRAIADS
jgi:hypothetical protein